MRVNHVRCENGKRATDGQRSTGQQTGKNGFATHRRLHLLGHRTGVCERLPLPRRIAKASDGDPFDGVDRRQFRRRRCQYFHRHATVPKRRRQPKHKGAGSIARVARERMGDEENPHGSFRY